MAGDVLEKNESWADLSDDPRDLGPQVASIARARSLAGVTERLAGVPRRDDIHDATPRAAIEGEQIVGDRRVIHDRFAHPRHESARGVSVPLNETHGSVGVSDGESDAEFQSADPGT